MSFRLSIYPLLKRVTHWPQAYLGFGMNFGLIVAWLDTVGELDLRLMGCMLLGCWWSVALYVSLAIVTDMLL